MNKQLLSFLVGLAIPILFFFLKPQTELTPIQDDKNLIRIDSIKNEFKAVEDSLVMLIDSLNTLPPKTEIKFVEINNSMQNEISKTDTFTNSDSLVSTIKRSIQSGRIKAD